MKYFIQLTALLCLLASTESMASGEKIRFYKEDGKTMFKAFKKAWKPTKEEDRRTFIFKSVVCMKVSGQMTCQAELEIPLADGTRTLVTPKKTGDQLFQNLAAFHPEHLKVSQSQTLRLESVYCDDLDNKPVCLVSFGN